jgi:hypothetical protein
VRDREAEVEAACLRREEQIRTGQRTEFVGPKFISIKSMANLGLDKSRLTLITRSDSSGKHEGDLWHLRLREPHL